MQNEGEYSGHKSIYHIAVGMKDDENNLMTTETALYSAILDVLSNSDQKVKEEFLGTAGTICLEEAKDMIRQGNKDYFLNVIAEAYPVPTSGTGTVFVKNKNKTWREDEGPASTLDDKLQSLDKAFANEEYHNNLLAARLRKDIFPVTDDFFHAHYESREDS